MDSIVIQARPPDEVIIADDGSGEETAGVVKRFAGIAPFSVLHVWQENKGFRAAKIRNEAIRRSSGEYLILLDGDCVVNRHFISDHLSLKEQGHFIQGKRVHVRENTVALFTYEHANSVEALIRMTLTGRISNIHHLIRLPVYFSVRNRKLKGIKSCNMSFLKGDALAVNGFNEDFVGWGNEDSDLAARFFHYGLTKKTHQFMAICFHLWHPTNKRVLNGNKELLAATLASKEYFCRNGIVKTN
jgi:glycosyltransferase involved in cell wall biosynthesis